MPTHSATFFSLIKCFGKGGVQYCFGEKARFGARQHVQKTMINHIIYIILYIYIDGSKYKYIMDYHGIYTFIRLKAFVLRQNTQPTAPPFPSPRRKQTGGHSHRPGFGAGTLTIKTVENLMGVKMNPVFNHVRTGKTHNV